MYHNSTAPTCRDTFYLALGRPRHVSSLLWRERCDLDERTVGAVTRRAPALVEPKVVGPDVNPVAKRGILAVATMQRGDRETVAQRIARLRKASELLARDTDSDSDAAAQVLPLNDAQLGSLPQEIRLPNGGVGPKVGTSASGSQREHRSVSGRRSSRPRLQLNKKHLSAASPSSLSTNGSNRRLERLAERPRGSATSPPGHPVLPPSPTPKSGATAHPNDNDTCRHCGANLVKEPHRSAHLLNGCPKLVRIEKEPEPAGEELLANLPSANAADKPRLPTLDSEPNIRSSKGRKARRRGRDPEQRRGGAKSEALKPLRRGRTSRRTSDNSYAHNLSSSRGRSAREGSVDSSRNARELRDAIHQLASESDPHSSHQQRDGPMNEHERRTQRFVATLPLAARAS